MDPGVHHRFAVLLSKMAAGRRCRKEVGRAAPLSVSKPSDHLGLFILSVAQREQINFDLAESKRSVETDARVICEDRNPDAIPCSFKAISSKARVEAGSRTFALVLRQDIYGVQLTVSRADCIPNKTSRDEANGDAANVVHPIAHILVTVRSIVSLLLVFSIDRVEVVIADHASE